MREIKFRGKSIYDDKWKYGDLHLHNDGSVCIGVTASAWTDDGIQNNDYLTITGVKGETVGQFTGLQDKNGKDLYEGDIISCRDEDGTATLLVVEFGTIDRIVKRNELNMCRITCFYYRNPDTNECLFPVIDDECPDVRFEIVGNIHDNPELQKGDKK